MPKTLIFQAQETLNSSEPCFFYAQDTLNSDLMRNYRFQGSLLGSPLGWPEKVLQMVTFLIGNREDFSSLRFSGILYTVLLRGSLSLKLLILNSILLNLRVIPHFIRADVPWDLRGFLRTSRLVLFSKPWFLRYI